ncbi:outer membrane protein assembly factor [Caldichromatium japonicum]|uniref:Translocation and assembly module subunit TamA n=1 Tax=Caldichromatium japonicum TaxID=2699430 RepID=A0A6G7VA68_9GAMM|nr:autotransporter assembly complex family protein [Caldichromatium japonicum]QIK36874.1 outer membrane protein assembly factor [Caldichromatium japonicum]
MSAMSQRSRSACIVMFLGALWIAQVQALSLKVEVTGLSGESEANVLALLSIYQERDAKDLTAARIEALHRRAPEQIRKALEPFGFYRAEIESQLEPPTEPDGAWRAWYRIDPGEPVRIVQIDYQLTGPGADDPALPRSLPLRSGEVLSHAAYEQAKSELQYAALSRGYVDYQLSRHRVLVDPLTNTALVELSLDTGPQYRFGPVQFKQDLLDERLLRRYASFAPGEIYNPDVLLALQGRLLSSEYYRDVEIIPHKEAADAERRIPIEVVAQRNLANKYRVGLGFATDVGPRLTLDYHRRYLNPWGDRLRAELSLAPAFSQWQLEYRFPIGDPTRDYILIRPFSNYYDTAAREGWVHGLQIAHSSQRPHGWRRTLGLDYRDEDLSDQGGRQVQLAELAPNVAWSKTVADDPINTNEGYRMRYSLVGAVQGVVADTSYLSVQAQLKWIKRLNPDYRLITRADLGATWAKDLLDLPASRRFYAGGDNSIRGWGFEALGPTDPQTDETLGGRYLAVGSLELERRIEGRWSLAIFTDFGNAFDPDYKQDIASSLGMGLRWASPLGPVRLDLAFALSKEYPDSSWPPARLHIVIGPDL